MLRPLTLVLAAAFALPALPLLAEEPAQKAPAASLGLPTGQTAPDVRMARENGNPVMLNDLMGQQPIVLIFYRGSWCPYCNKSLQQWQGAFSDIAGLGAVPVGITPEGPDGMNKTTEQDGVKFLVLSDFEGDAARKFNIAFDVPEEVKTKYKGYGIDLAARNWSKTWQLPHPAVFVIGKDKTIRYASVNEDYTVRTDPAEVIQVLKDMKAGKIPG